MEIHDASELWGKGVHDTVKYFKEKYGEKDLSVIAIGPGGERLSRFACWVNENDRASGRGGTGCVDGSKNLKAVVIKATKKMPKAVNKEVWKETHSDALKQIKDIRVITSPRKGALSVHGTNVLMNMVNVIGAMPTRNSQSTFFEPHEMISGEYVKENILVEDPTCHACPVACKKEVEIKEGPNDYSLDAIEIGNVLSMYMEATEKGYTNGDGGLQWGDGLGMVETTRKIAFREGIGDVLAEGAERAAKHFGHPEISMTVKGMAIPAYDPRGIKGMGIAYATSNRGACHLRAYTPAAEVIGNVLGPATLTDPLEWKGKGDSRSSSRTSTP